MRPLIAALLLVVAAGCGGAGRDEPSSREAPFTVRPFAPAIHAVCYGPHRDGQRPGGPEPSVDQVREDLELMVPRWNLMRIYGSTGVAETILEVIRADGLAVDVMLGVWIAPDAEAANQQEIAAAVRLARAYPGIVVAVCVGNETQVDWSAHRSPQADLIRYVRLVRSQVAVPVTVADDFNFWNKPASRPVAAEIDFITMHAHPMWNGLQLAGALAWLRDQVGDIRSKHPDRFVVLGETGWATMVHDEGEQAELIKGRFGEAEQKIFHEQVRAWAEADRQTVFFFEAFDENWKGGAHPDEVEKHWGLFRADRTPKAALADPGAR